MFQCCIIFNSTDETELDGRLLVVARVPQVSMLNGSKVRVSFSLLTFILKQVYQKERQNAEIHYIMKYFPDWIRAKKSGTERDFASNHMQYRRLSEGTVLCTEKHCSQKNTCQNISYIPQSTNFSRTVNFVGCHYDTALDFCDCVKKKL